MRRKMLIMQNECLQVVFVLGERMPGSYRAVLAENSVANLGRKPLEMWQDRNNPLANDRPLISDTKIKGDQIREISKTLKALTSPNGFLVQLRTVSQRAPTEFICL
jgi:hypothetical protein